MYVTRELNSNEVVFDFIEHSQRYDLSTFLRVTFCSKFYENRWLDFVDIALFIFLNR